MFPSKTTTSDSLAQVCPDMMWFHPIHETHLRGLDTKTPSFKEKQYYKEHFETARSQNKDPTHNKLLTHRKGKEKNTSTLLLEQSSKLSHCNRLKAASTRLYFQLQETTRNTGS
jgi:hypothetical protein